MKEVNQFTFDFDNNELKTVNELAKEKQMEKRRSYEEELLAKADKPFGPPYPATEESTSQNDLKNEIALSAIAKEFSQKEKPVKKEKEPEKTYDYPFILHFAGKNIETDHIFTPGEKYKEEEIRVKMLDHQYYEFAGKTKFEYIEKENVIIPIFEQHKKG